MNQVDFLSSNSVDSVFIQCSSSFRKKKRKKIQSQMACRILFCFHMNSIVVPSVSLLWCSGDFLTVLLFAHQSVVAVSLLSLAGCEVMAVSCV
jgi:hypothetical protein